MEERFNATLKLAQLPRNGAKTAFATAAKCPAVRARYYRKLGMSRIALREFGSGPRSRPGEVELVRSTLQDGDD
jgi:small subunit ribosomal protein S14